MSKEYNDRWSKPLRAQYRNPPILAAQALLSEARALRVRLAEINAALQGMGAIPMGVAR